MWKLPTRRGIAAAGLAMLGALAAAVVATPRVAAGGAPPAAEFGSAPIERPWSILVRRGTCSASSEIGGGLGRKDGQRGGGIGVGFKDSRTLEAGVRFEASPLLSVEMTFGDSPLDMGTDLWVWSYDSTGTMPVDVDVIPVHIADARYRSVRLAVIFDYRELTRRPGAPARRHRWSYRFGPIASVGRTTGIELAREGQAAMGIARVASRGPSGALGFDTRLTWQVAATPFALEAQGSMLWGLGRRELRIDTRDDSPYTGAEAGFSPVQFALGLEYRL